MQIDDFDLAHDEPTYSLTFSYHDSSDIQHDRVETFSNYLINNKHFDFDIFFNYAKDILSCVEHCKSALSVLECRIISSISGRVLLSCYSLSLFLSM